MFCRTTRSGISRAKSCSVIAGKITEHDFARLMPDRVVLQNIELLLRAERGGAVVLHLFSGDLFKPCRPRFFAWRSHRLDERVAQRGNVDRLSHGRIPKTFSVGFE